ncbi:hypothetical protein [Novosphingobium sp.]|uniref:hypothetical protein n=1 Tax=Novosphingobium sp. TaxID=1874826 RepID=UPI001DE57C43|nr:hypothetical protein [Novosphingobium sp.]MBX9662875.1 hypothetical protein [Novosphingobium sp.]
MTEVPEPEAGSTNDTIRWAWDIHKDADALLHSRLQGFMAFNAILGGGYFLSSRITQAPPDEIMRFIPPIIAFFGLCLGLVFITYTRRIVQGIKRLKSNYLLHDPVYKIYYGDYPTEDGVKYWFAHGMPSALIALWVILLAIGSLLATR